MLENRGSPMQKYRHTRRSVILFFLLTPLTLFIYPIVVLHHIGKEVNQMNADVEGYKKSMPFVGAFFLGFITLGIVPIVWLCKVSGKLGRKGYALGIRKPHTSIASMLLLGIFFSFFIITAIIAWTKFLHTANAIERKLNELADEKAKEEAEAEILPEEPAPEAAEVKEEPAPEEAEAKEEIKEEPVAEEPAPEAVAIPEEPAPEIESEPEEENTIPEAYRPAPRKTVRKWRVRLSNSDEFKVFDTEEEAMAYARGLAFAKNAKLRVKK